MEEKHKEKTALFSTKGLFQFKVMHFGLCYPHIFSEVSKSSAASLQWTKCLVYLDDVIVIP